MTRLGFACPMALVFFVGVFAVSAGAALVMISSGIFGY
jgi:hypothetical protein